MNNCSILHGRVCVMTCTFVERDLSVMISFKNASATKTPAAPLFCKLFLVLSNFVCASGLHVILISSVDVTYKSLACHKLNKRLHNEAYIS